MENLIWAKSILNVYSSIENYILKIDSTIENISLMPEFGVDAITNKIIELSDRKISLINLKLVIEQLIASCKPKSIRIISLRHIQKLTMEEIADHLETTERTCYRMYANAIDEFVSNMKKYGYTSIWLYQNLKEEKWILHEFYKEYKKMENNKQIERQSDVIKSRVRNILRASQFRSNLY